MKNLKKAIFFFLGLCLLSSCYYENEEELNQFDPEVDCEVVEASYSLDVLPIMQQYCLFCHNPDNPQGDIDLFGHDKIQVSALDGSLLGSINFEDGWSPMPPSGEQIPGCDIETIRIWIEQGAIDN